MLNPAAHVDKKDQPLLIYHGLKDRVVPVEQGIIIDHKYRKAKLESTLHIIKGAGHGFRRKELPGDKASAEMSVFLPLHRNLSRLIIISDFQAQI